MKTLLILSLLMVGCIVDERQDNSINNSLCDKNLQCREVEYYSVSSINEDGTTSGYIRFYDDEKYYMYHKDGDKVVLIHGETIFILYEK